MAKHGPQISLFCAAVIALVGLEAHSAAESHDRLKAVVLVINQSAVPSSVLARAEAETTRIYERVGVTVIWLDAEARPASFDFTMKVVRTTLSRKEVQQDALGLAAAADGVRGRTAYAFASRIADFSEQHGVNPGVILGHVMAHELGHLLLPYNSHTKTGIMSGAWDDAQATRASRGALAFNAAESARIREALCGER